MTKRLSVIFGALFLFLTYGLGSLCAQNDLPRELSTIELSVETLLSQDTPPALRQAHTRALLKDPNAHSALIKILLGAGNDTAKIIICRAIATSNDGYPVDDLIGKVSGEFIDPLFEALFSQNSQLTRWAGRCLAMFDEEVTTRLAEIAIDPKEQKEHRIAAIGALELMPGANPVFALASLLQDEDDQIRDRAAKGLTEMLYLPWPLNIEDFSNRWLPYLLTVDETSFLRIQLQRQKEQLRKAGSEISQYRREIDLWRSRYLSNETQKFEQLKTPSQKMQLLERHLQNEQEASLRIWAAERIVEWSKTATVRSDDIAERLVDLLGDFISDSNARVRQLTAMALARLDYQKVLPKAGILLEQLVREKDTATQVALLGTLGKIEYTQALDKVLVLWETASEDEVSAGAVLALGRLCTSQSNPASTQQVEKVAQSLAGNFEKRSGSDLVRRELVQAMKKIAEQETSRQLANVHFDSILKEVLSDDQATVRSDAVYALTELHQQKSLAMLLETSNMLNDKDTLARFAVIAAIKRYGDKRHLSILRQRVIQEEDEDVEKGLFSTLETILNSVSLKDSYQWASKLEGTSRKEEQLKEQAFRALLDKINKEKVLGHKVDLQYERTALLGLAQIAQRQNQPTRAVAWFSKLLNLDISLEQKKEYRMEILSIALVDKSTETLLEAQLAVAPLLAISQESLEKIDKVCDQYDLSDEDQLAQCAGIAAMLIVPLTKFPSEELKQQWQERISQITLAIIDLQEQYLGQEGQKNIKAIEILPQLYSQMKDYPMEGTVQERKAVVQKFRTILAPTKNISLPKTSQEVEKVEPEPTEKPGQETQPNQPPTK